MFAWILNTHLYIKSIYAKWITSERTITNIFNNFLVCTKIFVQECIYLGCMCEPTRISKNIFSKHCVKSVRIRSYSGPYFPAFGLITERYFVSLRIQSECGKMRTSITSNTDIFYAVFVTKSQNVWNLVMGDLAYSENVFYTIFDSRFLLLNYLTKFACKQ